MLSALTKAKAVNGKHPAGLCQLGHEIPVVVHASTKAVDQQHDRARGAGGEVVDVV